MSLKGLNFFFFLGESNFWVLGPALSDVSCPRELHWARASQQLSGSQLQVVEHAEQPGEGSGGWGQDNHASPQCEKNNAKHVQPGLFGDQFVEKIYNANNFWYNSFITARCCRWMHCTQYQFQSWWDLYTPTEARLDVVGAVLTSQGKGFLGELPCDIFLEISAGRNSWQMEGCENFLPEVAP